MTNVIKKFRSLSTYLNVPVVRVFGLDLRCWDTANGAGLWAMLQTACDTRSGIQFARRGHLIGASCRSEKQALEQCGWGGRGGRLWLWALLRMDLDLVQSLRSMIGRCSPDKPRLCGLPADIDSLPRSLHATLVQPIA